MDILQERKALSIFLLVRSFVCVRVCYILERQFLATIYSYARCRPANGIGSLDVRPDSLSITPCRSSYMRAGGVFSSEAHDAQSAGILLMLKRLLVSVASLGSLLILALLYSYTIYYIDNE